MKKCHDPGVVYMIYCVEDDGSIKELMLYALNAAGLPAHGFGSGAELTEALREARPSLVMLDIMLPGEDGIEILKRLRSDSATADIPVIMATAKGSEYDKVIGLDLGADDYLAKPFGMMEMVSRVRAVLRRAGPKDEGTALRAGALTMDLVKHTVTSGNERVALTLKEYELLRAFMESPGVVFTRDRLLERVWGEGYLGETRTVDVHVGTLRAKLGPCGEYIETVRGVGYRLEANRD